MTEPNVEPTDPIEVAMLVHQRARLCEYKHPRQCMELALAAFIDAERKRCVRELSRHCQCHGRPGAVRGILTGETL